MNNKNYVPYHVHTDFSNANMMDSTTKYKMYIEKAKELGMKALAFSEHGNIYGWVNKKLACNKEGIKYIHGVETYLTKTLDEKVRDNFHIGLYARNYEGVKELNKLVSKSFNKDDNHFYYNPRISVDELKATSNNIIITTACLAGVLSKGDNDLMVDMVKWFAQNKHRVFLEVQPHRHVDQIKYNQRLHAIHKKFQIPLIAGTDTHNLDDNYARSRKYMQLAKNIKFSDEDSFDISFKSYEGLVELFEEQQALPKEVYLQAIENTNVFADMVEDFEFDRSHKYPKLYSNPEGEFKKRISNGLKRRGLESLQEYRERIKEEYPVYKGLGAIDYMLFQDDTNEVGKGKGIDIGYGRGSVNGSIIAYLMGMTEMDSIKHKLNFFRFMNPHRISLCDIDIDHPPTRRQEVIDYVLHHPKVHGSAIITFNTIAEKGTIDDLGRAMEIPLDEVARIKDSLESKDEKKYREKYPELFELIPYTKGTIVSIGSHPSGFLVSPTSIEEDLGVTIIDGLVVCQCNMKEVDFLNYVKLDVLGLDNIEIINETCKMVGIERLTPDNIDVDDDKVWDNIRKSGLGIFQFESDNSHSQLSKALDPKTLAKFMEIIPNLRRIDVLETMNAIIRPSCDSFREDFLSGKAKDNGYDKINELLADTMGYMVYQEQIMLFLVEFCGYSQSESDNVRRAIGKKLGTEELLPEIERRFIETMTTKYGMEEDKAQEIAKTFIQIILDASNYGFSKNHACPYAYTGYACGYLRTYYPLEFLTIMFRINEGKKEKTSAIFEYMHKFTNIELRPIQFGKSRADYSFDRNTNCIYKGVKSIKFLNNQVAEELYELSKEDEYDTFTNLLIDIREKTSCNARQLKVLITLNFFKEFGENKKLLDVFEVFDKRYKKTHKDKTKVARRQEVNEFEVNTPNEKLTYIQQAIMELDYLGYIESITNKATEDYCIIMDTNKRGNNVIVTLYQIKTGNRIVVKAKKKTFDVAPFKKLDVLKVLKTHESGRWSKAGNKWVQSKTEMELIMDAWKVIQEKELN